MNKDNYDEILNGPETYKEIASQLLASRRVLVGWTDELGSHFDILFTYGAEINWENQLTIQGGVRKTDLFVSIMRIGAFAFDIGYTDTDWRYYDEKLGGGRIGKSTGEKLAELINGIKKELSK